MDAPIPDERDPLDQPTAARLFSLLVSSRRRLTTTELAARARVHPNSARLHLGRLADAGLVQRASASSGTGRPHYEWSVAPGALVDGESPVAYRELAGWLGEALIARGVGPHEVEAAGVAIGRAEAPVDGARSSAEVLETALAAMGFRPSRERRGTRTTFTLGNCPYRAVAKAQPGIVCVLHRGIAKGLLDAIEPGARLSKFEIKDADAAGCLVEIESGAERNRHAHS